MDALGVARAMIATILLLWLPGWAWGRILVPSARGVARIVLSIALSLAIMTLALYIGNVLLAIPLTAETGILMAVSLALAAGAISLGRELRRRVDDRFT